MERLVVGLSTWILQDGNYPDFHVGHEYQFAWFVHKILLETTPWKEAVDESGRRFLMRDASRRSYEGVTATNAGKHDAAGHYLLECELCLPKAV